MTVESKLTIVDRYIKGPAVAAFIGTGAWFSDEIARDIAETAFKDATKYGEPQAFQSVINWFLPPNIRAEVRRVTSLGQENFSMAQRIKEQAKVQVLNGDGLLLSQSNLNDRRN